MTKHSAAGWIAAFMVAAALQHARADDDHDDYRRSEANFAVQNKQYQEECGSCHFAYPPQFLPEQSWHKIMDTLDSHFGDVASLDPLTTDTLRQYLAQNSADAGLTKHSRKIVRSLGGRSPVRITGTPWFMAKHDEVPLRLVHGNDQVRSFSNCTACHSRGDEGSFSEREIRIAGYGKWDD